MKVRLKLLALLSTAILAYPVFGATGDIYNLISNTKYISTSKEEMTILKQNLKSGSVKEQNLFVETSDSKLYSYQLYKNETKAQIERGNTLNPQQAALLTVPKIDIPEGIKSPEKPQSVQFKTVDFTYKNSKLKITKVTLLNGTNYVGKVSLKFGEYSITTTLNKEITLPIDVKEVTVYQPGNPSSQVKIRLDGKASVSSNPLDDAVILFLN